MRRADAARMKLSSCGRFVVLEFLHIDREVLDPLAAWADAREIGLQDAIQLAVVGFVERTHGREDGAPPRGARSDGSATPVHEPVPARGTL